MGNELDESGDDSMPHFRATSMPFDDTAGQSQEDPSPLKKDNSRKTLSAYQPDAMTPLITQGSKNSLQKSKRFYDGLPATEEENSDDSQRVSELHVQKQTSLNISLAKFSPTA